MEIEDANGNKIGMVKKSMITPVRDRWTVKIKNGPDLDVQGNIVDHEYSIGEGRDKVAEVSKKWFHVARQLWRRGRSRPGRRGNSDDRHRYRPDVSRLMSRTPL